MAVANRKIKFSGKTFVTPTSGGGGGGSSLTVEEQDGVPSVSPVNTIRVSNGTLTDEGGGVVSIVTGVVELQPAKPSVKLFKPMVVALSALLLPIPDGIRVV